MIAQRSGVSWGRHHCSYWDESPCSSSPVRGAQVPAARTGMESRRHVPEVPGLTLTCPVPAEAAPFDPICEKQGLSWYFAHLAFPVQPNADAKVLPGHEKHDALLVSRRQELAAPALPVLGFRSQGAEEDFPLVEGKKHLLFWRLLPACPVCLRSECLHLCL